MDEAIDRALDMQPAERREVMTAMRERVTRWDVGHWARHVTERFNTLTAAQNEKVKRRETKAA